MYGTRLARDFGESVPEVWKQAISTLKRYEIDRGLRRLTTGGSGSPPTLPQFMKACKMTGDDEGTLRPASTFQALPKPVRPENRFLMIGNFELLRFLLKHDIDFKFMDDYHDIRQRATHDYFEIDKEDPVKDEEFRQYLRREFSKVIPDAKQSEALRGFA